MEFRHYITFKLQQHRRAAQPHLTVIENGAKQRRIDHRPKRGSYARRTRQKETRELTQYLQSSKGDGKMQFKIHFEHADGTEDDFIVNGDTVEEIREVANKGIAQRNGRNPWSEKIGANRADDED